MQANDITIRLDAKLRQATGEDKANGVLWYPEALHHCQRIVPILAETYGEHLATIENAVGILAALSPRKRWNENIRDAISFAWGKPLRATLGRSIETANKVLTRGLSALTGRKSRNFADAILGNPDAVVVDTWIAKACELPRDNPTKRQYDWIESSFRLLSHRYKISARDLQAIVWVVQRTVPF